MKHTFQRFFNSINLVLATVCHAGWLGAHVRLAVWWVSSGRIVGASSRGATIQSRHIVANNSVHAPKPFANGFFCAQHGACTVLAHGFSAKNFLITTFFEKWRLICQKMPFAACFKRFSQSLLQSLSSRDWF